ncbi:MAG TPA: hypothetical protein VJN70_04340 [Gemmatimonadaceae bacterium]|nr:hypothetical protein [Gemmatimonadaceae bacterium]
MIRKIKKYLRQLTRLVTFRLSVQDASGPRKGQRPPEQERNTAA